ncbi:MAG: hypothetical protein K6F27_05665 [Ruminococcus sp.]|nr:hypothetical protein [Ruminococcus sp.]
MKNINGNKIPIGITVLILTVIATTVFACFNTNSYEVTPGFKTESSSHSETTPIDPEKSSPDSAIMDCYPLNISQPTPITQKLVFSQSEESQVKDIAISAKNEGTYAFTLTEVYNGSYYELKLCNEYGDTCSNVTTIDYSGTSNKGIEYDGIKPGKYILKVKYYGSGNPTCLLTIYNANKTIDISEHFDNVIISDSFSAPWMRNYYTVSINERSTFIFTTESGEYFEIDFLDKYGNCVHSLNGLQTDKEVNLNSGEYTLDIHCCSSSQPYTIRITKT